MNNKRKREEEEGNDSIELDMIIDKFNTQPEKGLAKLYGINTDNEETVEIYIKELPAILGRSHNNPPKNFINLGSNKKFSRQHATIDYDKKKDQFIITVLGKNGLSLNNELKFKKEIEDEKLIYLKNGAAIRIGTICMYFSMIVVNNKMDMTYEDLAVNVLNESLTLLTNELYDQNLLLSGNKHNSNLVKIVKDIKHNIKQIQTEGVEIDVIVDLIFNKYKIIKDCYNEVKLVQFYQLLENALKQSKKIKVTSSSKYCLLN